MPPAQRRSVEPPRFEEDAIELAIDGQLDEAIWDQAAVAETFYLFEPVDEGFPDHQTRVRIFYTRPALYLAFECEASPEDLHVALSPRDASPEGDYVAVLLDTFADGQRAYSFTVSAAASQLDERVVWGLGFDASWDTTFEAEVSIGDAGYVVEMRIPFRDLRFSDEPEQRWGIQLKRRSWRDQQTAVWARQERDIQNEIQQFGRISLRDIESGSDLQLLPSLTVSWVDDAEVDEACELEVDAGTFSTCGVDINYGLGARYLLGSALTLDAVFNPDFSQVEADPGLLTLNERFALFLEERRPFFLEGRDIFQSEPNIVYTRSIGRPLAGLKLTGSVAERTRLGLLATYDLEAPDSVLDPDFSVPRDDDGEPLSQVTTVVGRVEQDVLASSRVGLFLVDREYTGESRGFNRLGGPNYRFELGDNWIVSGMALGSWAEDLVAGEPIWGIGSQLDVEWRVERWTVLLEDIWLDRDFRAESGFITRTGYHALRLKLDHLYYSDRPLMRFISPGIQSQVFFDSETGELFEGFFEANTWWSFDDRNYVYVDYTHALEDVEATRFNTNQIYFEAGSTQWPAFSPAVSVTLAEDILRDPSLWEGDEAELGSSLTLDLFITSQPISRLAMEATLRLRSLYRDFLSRELLTQRIARFESTYLFSNALNLRLIVEFLSPEEELSFDTLLSYVPSPGTVFFLGYQDIESVADGFELITRGAFLKFSYLWAN
jgi:hypothetical protein